MTPAAIERGDPLPGARAKNRMGAIWNDAAERAIRYRQGVPSRAVAPSPDALLALERNLGGSLPEHSCDPKKVIAMLDEFGSPATMASTGGRFFGFVIGSSLPEAVAANWLATAWDQNTGLFAAAPGTTLIESIALGWILEVLDLPRGSAGAFVTGCQMANFTALAAARHSLLHRQGWDVERRGLFGAPEIPVVVGMDAHSTLLKALSMLGMGRDRILRVEVDEQGRMRADRLPKVHAPPLVCVQHGNVNTGAFDPVSEIAAWTREHGGWIHLDGAFGLWARATPRLAALSVGAGECDSWATDAHKWLNVPYDCGIAVVRDLEALLRSMGTQADYLPESPIREPMHFTPELSRRARGVEVWAVLKSLGRSGVAELIERCCALARRFADGIERMGHEVLNEVNLNQVLVSFGSDAETSRVMSTLQSEGTCWFSGTQWFGRKAMRISVSSWATDEQDVDDSLAAIARVVQSICGRRE